jgi:hypothetical protein
MMPTLCREQAPVPPPSYHRREVQAQAQRARALPINALKWVEILHLLALCRLAIQLAHRRCPPPLPKGAGGRPRTYSEASLLLIALLKTLWRLSYQDMHEWLESWPALAQACGLPLDVAGNPRIPSASQLCKRGPAAGAPPFETLFVLTVWHAVRCHLIGARDLIIDSAPILAWRRKDPDAAFGHAPAHHARSLLCGYRVHTLLCRGSGLPVHFLLSPANRHDAPFARPLVELAVRLYAIRPRIIRLDAAYWGLHLIHWIHATLGAIAVVRLPSEATKEPLVLAAHLDSGGIGQTKLHRTLLWSSLSLLSAATTSLLGLVCHCPAGRFDLHGLPHRRFGRLARWSS